MKTPQPTALQRTAYEAVIRLGTQAAAARELGQYQGTIRGAVLRYCHLTGEPLPEGMTAGSRRPTAAGVLRETPARLDAIERDLAAALISIDRLVALVSTFVDRQPVILGVSTGSNQRRADGGAGGRQVARDTRVALRQVAGR